MSPVKPGMPSFIPNYRPVGSDVQIDDTTLRILLADGRTLVVPFADWAFLAQATPAQRRQWEFEPGNAIIYWPALDDGLAIAHLLGMAED